MYVARSAGLAILLGLTACAGTAGSGGAVGRGGGSGSLGAAGTGATPTGGSQGGSAGAETGTAGTTGAAGTTGSAGAGGEIISGTAGTAVIDTAGTTGSGGAIGGGGTTGSGGMGGSAAAGRPGTIACPSGTFICEDFEAYATGVAPTGIWSKDARGSGTVAVDATRAFSGTKSLHVTGTINGDAAHITTPVAITANTTFVRLMMYTLGYPSSSGVHSHLARLGTTADSGPDSAYSLSSYNGTAIEKVDSIYLRNTATHLNDANMKNRWVCLEFEIDKTGGVGKVVPHIWVDGTELALAAAGSSSHAGTSTSWDPIPFQKFTLGLDGNQVDAVKGDFWLDDVTIASSRIGCLK